MRKVYLVKDPNGDTRTAPEGVTFEEFQRANRRHIRDVEKVMSLLAGEIEDRGIKHDFTKISREAEFYRDFEKVVYNQCDPGTNFTDLPWYKMHVSAERHHLNNNIPEDVNLIDVLEMIVDVVCATKARRGNDATIAINGIDYELMNKAVMNTALMLDEAIEVKDHETTHEYDGWRGQQLEF